jgi:peptidoglycan-associated lipoprotein
MTLGGSRAEAVQRYLVDLGVGKDRMRATSRGEMDATGTDEHGWAQDRRVDIELVL